MKGDQKLAEAAIARVVIRELGRLGYETYEEVQPSRYGNRADIVGLRGPEVLVVECKVSMGLAVLNQAVDWKGRAHRIIAAVGRGKSTAVPARWLSHEGIGLWEVFAPVSQWEAEHINEIVAPRFFRRADAIWIRKACCEQTRTGSAFADAGTNGGHYTPFRQTAMALAEVVKAEPGLTLREAVIKAGHHYSSAKSAVGALPALIRNGAVAGVEVRVEDGRLRVYPKGDDTAAFRVQVDGEIKAQPGAVAAQIDNVK